MKRKSFHRIVLAFVVFVILRPDGARAAFPVSKSLWSNLTQLAKVQSIEIHDDWMGLSEYGPVGRYYSMKPEGDQFTGKAVFSLGGGPLLKTKEEPISVPKATVQDFLNLLAQSQLDKGEYKPNIEHTDDYPSVTIDVQFAGDKLSFFSKSQGEWAVPWGVSLGGESYVSRSKSPAMAMKLLQPFFKHESMEKLMEEYRAQMHNR